jgi:transposase
MKLKELLENGKIPPKQYICSRCGIRGTKNFKENPFNKGQFLCGRCDEHINSDIVGK